MITKHSMVLHAAYAALAAHKFRVGIGRSAAGACAITQYFAAGRLSGYGVALTPGAAVGLHFTIPQEISGRPERACRCVGRIVRVDKPRRFLGRRGVGIQFDYYGLVPLAKAS